jgi:hypothetical protein
MKEQEARAVFSVAVAISKVVGGDVRQMCAKRGVSNDLISKFLVEQNLWDRSQSVLETGESPARDDNQSTLH